MSELFDLIKRTIEKEGFITYNHIKVEKIEKDYAEVSVEITKNSLNPYGIIHGGLLFSLADTVMGIAGVTTGRPSVTLNSQINYLKPGKGKKIKAIAKKIKVGKTTAVYKCDIYDEQDEIIAMATGTYFFTMEPKE